jgi:hypothetical protein
LSCQRFGIIESSDSKFAKWLAPQIEARTVDAAYFKAG